MRIPFEIIFFKLSYMTHFQLTLSNILVVLRGSIHSEEIITAKQ